MNSRIKVKRPFRGLHEGDVLVFNPDNSMFELRESGEVLSDNYQSKSTVYVSFSPNFIEQLLGQNFEDVDGFFEEEIVEELTYEEPTYEEFKDEDCQSCESCESFEGHIMRRMENLENAIFDIKTNLMTTPKEKK